MSLSVKILEKQAGHLHRTATASLGGVITSEDTGYTTYACSSSHSSTTHDWTMTGTSGLACHLEYVSTVACADGKQVYVYAEFMTTSSGMDSMSMRVVGSTAGLGTAESITNPTANTWYELSGIVTMDGTYTGYVTPRWRLADAGGVTGAVFKFRKWICIDLTTEFGAGSEPTAAQLDAWMTWRHSDWDYPNDGLYNSYGDKFYYASKIASHGLTQNDIVGIDLTGHSADIRWAAVYPLNTDWIITSSWEDYARGTAAVDVEYWIKTAYTSRFLVGSLNINMRDDADGSAKVALRGDTTWQPQLGMQATFYDDSDELFTGYITRITKTDMNASNWLCECELSSLLRRLNNTYHLLNDTTGDGTSLRNMVQWLWGYYMNTVDTGSPGGQCLWLGNIGAGNASVSLPKDYPTSIYNIIRSYCDSMGMLFEITTDRRLNVRSQTATAESAPRDLTDAAAPNAQAMQYVEDIDSYANYIQLFGGYNTEGDRTYGEYAAAAVITDDIYAGNPSFHLVISDSNIISDTDATTAAELYYNRYGIVLPGQLTFTTTDTDYRPGQKLTVQVARLGIASSIYMHIDSVILTDPGGNLQSQLVCSRRDNTTFAKAPNGSINNTVSSVSEKIALSVPALTQDAASFTPALKGSTADGTWAWTTQTGYYVKHGIMCFVSIQLVPSSITDSPTGNLTLTGLPFTSAANPNNQFLQVFSSGVSWGTNMTQIQLDVTASSTEGVFYGSYNNGAWGAVAVGNIVATDDIRIMGWYQITP